MIIEGDEAAPEGEEGAGAVEGSPAAAAGEVPLEGEGEEEAAPQPRKGEGNGAVQLKLPGLLCISGAALYCVTYSVCLWVGSVGRAGRGAA